MPCIFIFSFDRGMAFFDLYVFIGLVVLGYGIGSWREKNHRQSIYQREATYAHILIVDDDYITTADIQQTELISSSVSIALDTFKKFLSSLLTLIGGRLPILESVLDRARREAILRLKEQAHKAWYTVLAHVRRETATILKNPTNPLWSANIIAYATACK